MTYVWNLSEDMPTKDGMAITHDYVDYLDEQIDIVLAGSQEEPSCSNHCWRNETSRAWGNHWRIWCQVSLRVLAIQSSNPSFSLALFLQALVMRRRFGCSARRSCALRFYFSNDILGSFGSSIRSQNVVAKHEATMSVSGNSSTVVASLWLPHTNFLVSCSKVRTSAQKYFNAIVTVFVSYICLRFFALPDPVRVLSGQQPLKAFHLLLCCNLIAERFCTLYYWRKQ